MPRVQVREVLRGGGGDATLEIIADLLQEAEDMPVLMVQSLLTPAAAIVATKLLTQPKPLLHRRRSTRFCH